MTERKESNYMNYISRNRRQSILTILLSVLIISSVTAGILLRLFFAVDILEGTDGIRTFRLFTVLSNGFLAFCCAMLLPYGIDGLRAGNYHLPRWVVALLLVAVNCVAATFVVTAMLILPAYGLYSAFLAPSDRFLHLISPVLAVVLFLLVNHSHRIPFRQIWFALIPGYLYMAVYLVMVFLVGEENGGWNDFYSVNAYVPWYLCAIAFLIGDFLLVNLLRIQHNRNHEKEKAAFASYYLTSPDYAFGTMEEAVEKLAKMQKERGGDLVLPRRILLLLMQRYAYPGDIADCMKRYLDAVYADNERK